MCMGFQLLWPVVRLDGSFPNSLPLRVLPLKEGELQKMSFDRMGEGLPLAPSLPCVCHFEPTADARRG